MGATEEGLELGECFQLLLDEQRGTRWICRDAVVRAGEEDCKLDQWTVRGNEAKA